MKTSKWSYSFIMLILLMSCSNPNTQADQLTVISPTQTIPFLDFDHPRLHEIAGNKPLIINEIMRTSIQGIAYVAVIVEAGNKIQSDEMLIFQVKDNISTLIYDLTPSAYMTFHVETQNHPSWLLDEIPPIGIPILLSNGGNCYDCGRMALIQITNDGKAKDVTPNSDFVPKGFVYISGSESKTGRIEIVATHYYEFDYGACNHVSSPFAFRLFQWQGTAYADVSRNEKDFYDQNITELTTKLQEFWNEPLQTCLVMPTLANIFFDYESSGRVEYGWEQIQALGDLSHWDIQNTLPEELQTYHDVFNQLKQRKNEALATATP